MGFLGLIFYYIGISMGWLYTFMGVILGSAVVPIALAITWKKANKWGCIAGAVGGFCIGIIAWLVTTATLHNGVIDVVTSGGDYEMLAGNLASIGVGGIVACVSSYFWPEDFNFDITRAINAPVPHVKGSSVDEPYEEEKKTDTTTRIKTEVIQENNASVEDLDPAALKKAFNFAAWSSIALTLVMIIIIPLPLFFAQTVYSVGGLSAWVVVGMIWTFMSAFIVVLYPLWESREALLTIGKGIIKDIFSPGSGKHVNSGRLSESSG
jgi:Na+/proline symporter